MIRAFEEVAKVAGKELYMFSISELWRKYMRFSKKEYINYVKTPMGLKLVGVTFEEVANVGRKEIHRLHDVKV